MMNILKTICLFAIGMMVMSSGCEKSETISPDPNQCYEGIVIATHCQSTVVVNVKNILIGEKWTANNHLANGVFDNAITIRNINYNDLSLQKGNKIYFQIDLEASKSSEPCINERIICTHDVCCFPNKKYCIKTISKQNCDENN